MMDSYYLSLGSNLGDRESNIRWGLEQLAVIGTVAAVSCLYETKPVGNLDQPDFMNAAAEFKTDLSPEFLLDRIKEIERAAGRDHSSARWSPRPLDIDILLHGMDQRSTPKLTIPHPRMLEREFVLAPLDEIAPDVVAPGTGETCGEHWKKWKSSHATTSVKGSTHALTL